MRLMIFGLLLMISTSNFAQETPMNVEKLGQWNLRQLPLIPAQYFYPNESYSDIWGYAANGREYAILGHFLGTSIIDVTDPTNPVEIGFIEGPASWWRDMKTYGHYAYVTHDDNRNSSTDIGVHIIDLSNLPNSVSLAARYTTNIRNGRAHNLYIEGKYLYLAGSRNLANVTYNHILDLTVPTLPVEVGGWSGNYWHDIISLNDTLYGSGIYGQGIQIIDAKNKSDLKLISGTTYNNLFTHNIWMTSDNKYIASTDEVKNFPIKFWDVSNHASPEFKGHYIPGPNAIAHNTHVLEDKVYISYYYDGLKIIDISDRNAPVEIGNYDTYPDDNLTRSNGGGYEGAWGTYPFLPSGNILISDRKYGLFIVKFNGAKPGHIYGEIRDISNNLLSDVKIELLTKEPSEGHTDVVVGADGKYSYGAKAGYRKVRFSKIGYPTVEIDQVLFEEGVRKEMNIWLDPSKPLSDRDEEVVINQFEIYPAYPNPFNPSTTISWRQPFSGQSTIIVFNSLGQILFEKVVTGNYGLNSQSLDFVGFSSGMYLFQIRSGNFISKTQKLTLMK